MTLASIFLYLKRELVTNCHESITTFVVNETKHLQSIIWNWLERRHEVNNHLYFGEFADYVWIFYHLFSGHKFRLLKILIYEKGI